MTTSNRVLGDRYEVGELLGYGGMAEVHQGRDLRLGRDVAIKMLRTDLARDQTFQARFRREAQNAASLNHPAIVAVYDTGEETGTEGESLPYIVMEYVAGHTLKEVLTAEGRLMPRRALEITADICGALEFSHRHGIIHRDIKPGNVMMTPTGQVKVMDFGIARAVASTTATMTQTSAVIGTAQYLSPEQARGETVDARSDVYATGCVLFELLCGAPPFTGESPVSVAYQHVREDPRAPSVDNPDVTPDIDAVVLKALAKNPANRYQSAAEMRADLLRAANGRPVRATPVLTDDDRTQIVGAAVGDATQRVPTTRVTDPDRRRRAMWVLVSLAALAVFAVAAFGVGLYLARSEPQLTVPDVTKQAETVAKAKIKNAGFTPKIQHETSTAELTGKVVQQNPNGGKKAPKGSDVTLTIGSGPETVTMPNLVGFTRAGAQSQLQLMGLVANFDSKPSAEPKDNVIGTDPKANTKVPKGATVTVYVSDNSLTQVPNVVGQNVSTAIGQLQSAGFQVNQTTDTTSKQPPGTVIAQNPAGNSNAVKGSTVTLTVAGSPSPSNTPTPSTSASGSASPSTSPSTLLP
jgi:beta-lactam-binding protein with PASTA domain/tRNA A-37 threonylcarbamoyl transferase component Bud32